MSILFFFFATCARVLPAETELEFFEAKIRPVLVERCYECHNSAGTDEAGLTLDNRQGLLDGGESGAAIIPGDSKNSLLMRIIRHEIDDKRMPKDNPKLSREITDDFAKWIDHGAVDPRSAPPTDDEISKLTSWETVRESRKKWWSFQPIADESVPAVKNRGWSNHPIDIFLLAKMEENGLSPSQPADPRTLIRRAYLTLIGLPPSPEQIETFVNDPSAITYAELIDRLLDSKHYGERWARHWMDWVRYAESHGSEGDPNLPNAWRYRDYLIRSLNQDVPYDQLMREHIAGDLLPEPRIDKQTGMNESMFGIAHYRFLEHGYAPTDALDAQARFTENQIDVISKTFLGLTVSCARCHDHKFDAVSQRDFYALYGIMISCRPAMVVADSIEQQETNFQQLIALKIKIKRKLADTWILSMEDFKKQLMTGENKAWTEAIGNAIKAGPSNPLSVWARLKNADDDNKESQWQEILKQWHGSRDALVARATTQYSLHWNLAGEDAETWNRVGIGLRDHDNRPGQFHLDLDGDAIVADLYPGGVFTNGISTKHNGFLTSPNFNVETDSIWMRILGGKNARIRYAMQHYPRVTGPIYQSHQANNEEFEWKRFDMRYWNGDKAYLEFATAQDIPMEASQDPRSWFGIAEVVGVNEGQPEPKDEPADFVAPLFAEIKGDALPTPSELAEAYSTAVKKAIEAWEEDSISDEQARFLSFFIKRNLLSNNRNEIPEVDSLLTEYRRLEDEIPVLTRTPGVIEGQPEDHPLFVRGNHKQPGELVPRRFLEALDDEPFNTKQSGRLELANHLADSKNPFMARVIVNRIWHYLFGQGIVETTDNFGRLGSHPTHPELLDFLANRFIEDGMSIKSLIKFVATSKTFQADSTPPVEAKKVDPTNHLLSHMRVRRLEAEAIRDSILEVSGQLDRSFFGEPVDDDRPRRSVYLSIPRNRLPQFLSVFDAPAPFSTVGRRDVTNVPDQSLALLNDPFVINAAAQLGNRISRDVSLASDRDRINQLFKLALGRSANNNEIDASLQFLADSKESQSSVDQSIRDLQRHLTHLRQKIESIESPIRESVLAARQTQGVDVASLVAPASRWDFDGNLEDSIGGLHGMPHGKTRFKDGRLVLDGKNFVATRSIGQTVTEKTLEVWVALKHLNQSGGGVMTLQTNDGHRFDSIVYAEREPQRWISGSNGFERTIDLDGMQELQQGMLIYLAVVYDKDGTITCYRDGELYGMPYKSSGPETYASGESHFLFGMRHGTAAERNGMFVGEIEKAQFYDRALTAAEIAASASGNASFVSQKQLLSKMSESQASEFKSAKNEIEKLNQAIAVYQKYQDDDPNSAWHGLAQAIFNFKEFIYIR